MTKYRYNRISEEIKKELAEILRQEVKDPALGFISLTTVDVTADLQQAKIYYSVMGDEEAAQKTAQAIKRSSGFIRRELARRLSLRHTPELLFHYDDSIQHGIRISQLLNDERKNRHEEDE